VELGCIAKNLPFIFIPMKVRAIDFYTISSLQLA